MTKQKGIFMGASDVKQPSANFKLQEFYLDCTYTNEFGDRYENILKLQANNDKVNLIHDLKKGDRIEVDYNVKGRFSTDSAGKKWHNQNLIIKSLIKIEVKTDSVPVVQNTEVQQPITQNTNDEEDDDDGLPF